MPNLRIKLGGSLAGASAQLLLQDALQVVILALGGGWLAEGGEEAHDLAVRLFAQGIGADGAEGVLQRLAVVARLRDERDQLVKRLEEDLLPPLLFRTDPILVIARDQGPA